MKKFKVGDQVSGPAFLSGTYQQIVAYKEKEVAHKPSELSHQIGAAFGVIFLTTFQALKKLQVPSCGEKDSLKGKRVLIIGGSGGTGSAAVLLAKKYFGADLVLAIASAKNSQFVQGLGADQVLDYTTGKDDLTEKLKSLSGTFDIVLDTIGGYNDYYGVDVLKPNDVSVFVTIAGEVPKETTVFGTRNASFHVMNYNGEEYEKILNWIVQDGLKDKIPISHVFKLEDVARAHQLIEAQRTVGKIILEIPQQ